MVDAAIGLVAAETNFNPFVVNKPFVCADAKLPVNAQLRGIVPLVDPAVGESDVENANSAKSVANPFTADGLSQAEVMIAQGFSNFTAVSGDGQNVVLDGQDGGAAGGNAGSGSGNGNNNGSGSGAGNSTETGGGNGNGASNGSGNEKDDGNGNANDNTGNAGGCGGNGNNNNNGGGNNTAVDQGGDQGNGNTNTDTSDLDFGLCQPTMAFIGGLNNRPATEFTFIPQDPLVAKGQQEALNPNIITNRICDQLTNVCEANDAAKAACLDAKAQIQALGTRDKSTADKWNALLGFADVDSSKQGL